MDRKQAGIIVTLLVLIVLAGVFAQRLNGPLYGLDGSGENNPMVESVDSSENNGMDFSFVDAQSTRDLQTTSTLQLLQDIIDDENMSAEDKKSASDEYAAIATQLASENRIEVKLKGQGYEDALCLIEDNVVKVYVKAGEELSEAQYAEIRAAVSGQAGLKEIEIQRK
jgi:stage III sporulation protein AH